MGCGMWFLSSLMLSSIMSLCIITGCQSQSHTHAVSESGHHISIGQAYEVQLPFQAGTGYAWSLDQSDSSGLDLISLTDHGVERSGASAHVQVGGPMHSVWEVRGLQAGMVTLHFVLQRPWESGVAPAESRTVRIRVKPADSDTSAVTGEE